LALIEQQIAVERTGYDQKIKALQTFLALETDTSKQVELRAEIRATGTAAIQAEIDKLQESGRWEAMSLQQQTDLVAQLLAHWSQIAGVALPEIQRQLTAMRAETLKLEFSVRGFLLSMSGQLKADFASFFEGLMDGTKRFRDLWQSVLADIQKWLAQIIAQYVWQQTVGGWLSGMLPAIAGGRIGGAGGAATTAAPNITSPAIPFAPAGSYRTAAAGAGAGGPTTMNVYINAVDAASFVDLAHRNRGGLAAILQTAMRENAPIGRRR
jgi:hypothetical protein